MAGNPGTPVVLSWILKFEPPSLCVQRQTVPAGRPYVADASVISKRTNSLKLVALGFQRYSVASVISLNTSIVSRTSSLLVLLAATSFVTFTNIPLVSVVGNALVFSSIKLSPVVRPGVTDPSPKMVKSTWLALPPTTSTAPCEPKSLDLI